MNGSAIAPAPRPARAPRVHHIAIQTSDVENCKAWYRDFFGCEVSWSLSRFSELTRRRLPGIRRLIELVVGDLRVHVFERAAGVAEPPGPDAVQFQHLGMVVDSRAELDGWRARWLELYTSGRYRFARSELPTEVVLDAEGGASFYAYDVNGLELELAFLPSGGA